MMCPRNSIDSGKNSHLLSLIVRFSSVKICITSSARGPCKTIPGYSSVGRPHSKRTDLQQADDSRCSVVNRDRNEDEFGFRGAEIVCYRPLCSGKASSSSCYTKSHVDTTSTCYLFCIIILDPGVLLHTTVL